MEIHGYKIDSQPLGGGTYAQVWRGTKEDKEYALKETPNSAPHGIKNLAELDIMCRFHHPHILRCLDFFNGPGMKTAKSFYIVTERADGTLMNYILSHKITMGDKVRLIYELLSVLHFLHSHNITHGDIKENNVLMFGPHLKLADFGMASYGDNMRICQIIDAASPEAASTLHGCLLPFPAPFVSLRAVDIWATGILIAQILRERPLFRLRDNRASYIKNIMKYKTDPEQYLERKRIPPGWRILLCRMLAIDAKERLVSIEKILRHPIFGTLTSKEPIPGVVLLTRPTQVKYYPGMGYLCKWMQIWLTTEHLVWRSCTAELAFLAYDIMYHTYPCIIAGEETNIKLLEGFGATAIIIAGKLIYGSKAKYKTFIAGGFDINFQYMEERIIIQLGGILYPPNRYHDTYSLSSLKRAAFDLLKHDIIPKPMYDGTEKMLSSQERDRIKFKHLFPSEV